MRPDSRPTLTVLAGVHGSGKTTVLGETLIAAGGAYFNPHAHVWHALVDMPEIADPQVAVRSITDLLVSTLHGCIAQRRHFAFEADISDPEIATLLLEAALEGFVIDMRYIGLDSASRCVRRVQKRDGGLAVSAHEVRDAYVETPRVLERVMHRLDHLVIFDNSLESDDQGRTIPPPRELLRVTDRTLRNAIELKDADGWVFPVVAAAIQCFAE